MQKNATMKVSLICLGKWKLEKRQKYVDFNENKVSLLQTNKYICGFNIRYNPSKA